MSYTFLKFFPFTSFRSWDWRCLDSIKVSSTYPIVSLGDCIIEESQKYSINTKGTQYGILGVNNQTGIFDAYEIDGSEINQKYKKMENGWIAYNPYRINVGSIGVKKSSHLFTYISPAYVVFRCNNKLNPEWFYLLMRSNLFQRVIMQSTTGSVRQILSFKALSSLKIPLPSLDEQNRLVKRYNDLSIEYNKKESEYKSIEESIKTYILSTLGMNNNVEQHSYTKSDVKNMKFIRLHDISKRWDCEYFTNNQIVESIYPLRTLKSLLLPIIGNQTKIQQKEIKSEGLYPVVTQEKGALVSGYTNNTALIDDLPLVVFGDHSCSFKYVDFAFVRGADGTKLLKFNKECNAYFYMELLSTIEIDNREKYQRHYKYIENKCIPLPPLSVQQEIVDHVTAERARAKALKEEAIRLREQAKTEFEKQIFA